MTIVIIHIGVWVYDTSTATRELISVGDEWWEWASNNHCSFQPLSRSLTHLLYALRQDFWRIEWSSTQTDCAHNTSHLSISFYSFIDWHPSVLKLLLVHPWARSARSFGVVTTFLTWWYDSSAEKTMNSFISVPNCPRGTSLPFTFIQAPCSLPSFKRTAHRGTVAHSTWLF